MADFRPAGGLGAYSGGTVPVSHRISYSLPGPHRPGQHLGHLWNCPVPILTALPGDVKTFLPANLTQVRRMILVTFPAAGRKSPVDNPPPCATMEAILAPGPGRGARAMLEQIKPMDIEKRSFEIITRLLGDRELDPENELVIKRVIHTSADFDYADNLVFSPHAVSRGIAALRDGCDIVTDSPDGQGGHQARPYVGQLGGEVHCFMADADVAAEAKESRGRPGPWCPWSGPRGWRSPASSPLATPPRPWCPSTG